MCSDKSGESTGPNDIVNITVTANRIGLTDGKHEGKIRLSSKGVETKSVPVSIEVTGGQGALGKLNVSNVSATHSAPSLVEYTFSLRDKNDNAVIADASAFTVSGMEDGTPINRTETGTHLATAANKQFRSFLVLDYTLSMASIELHEDQDDNGLSDTIDAMESAAKDVFLASLTEDALVGIYEFHTESVAPQKVADFTADKTFLGNQIDTLWETYVRPPGQFGAGPGGSRAWDALYAAVSEFTGGVAVDESRYVVLLSDGLDSSSTRTPTEIIQLAKTVGVRIYCIGFGAELDTTLLQLIATQTKGQYYSAESTVELEEQFQKISSDLQGRYTVRWAASKTTLFQPSFKLELGADSVTYIAAQSYTPSTYQGDRLMGALRLVVSEGASTSSAVLRATYVPRSISKIEIILDSDFVYAVSVVSAEDGGLVPNWIVTDNDAPAKARRVVTLETNEPQNFESVIPFAAFGPLLRFEFAGVPEEGAPLFNSMETDDSIYSGTGQSFVVTLP